MFYHFRNHHTTGQPVNQLTSMKSYGHTFHSTAQHGGWRMAPSLQASFSVSVFSSTSTFTDLNLDLCIAPFERVGASIPYHTIPTSIHLTSPHLLVRRELGSPCHAPCCQRAINTCKVRFQPAAGCKWEARWAKGDWLIREGRREGGRGGSRAVPNRDGSRVKWRCGMRVGAVCCQPCSALLRHATCHFPMLPVPARATSFSL
mmetsp:Transcript_68351/g.189968  ORF Transcript_68351/g.189968 Transcript_68351/m.189968 type:complete len:203 (-) Transcript_68351:1567-2175(-)